MRKFLIVSLTVLVCLSLTSMVQAKVAVVATFVSDDNVSSLHVFDIDNMSNIFEMYSTTPVADVQFRALDVGTFVVDPVTSQVVVATYDTANNRSYASGYTLSPTAGNWNFDTGKTTGYIAVDIASGQFDDDALDEYAMAIDVADTKWNEYGGRLRIGDGDDWIWETRYIPDRYITGVAVGQYDDDAYDEIVVSTYSALDNETGQVLVWDHMGGGSQQYPIYESAKMNAHIFTDVATGDYTLDGKSETYISTDERPWQLPSLPDGGSKAYSQVYRYNQPPDNGTWDWFEHGLKTDGVSSYASDEALLKIATLNVDDDAQTEFVVINQQDPFEMYPGVWFQEAELRLHDDNSTGGGEGMVMANKDTSGGKVYDVITKYTSVATGDLNGDGYDDMVVGHVSQGPFRGDPDPNVKETSIRVFLWDPVTQYYVYKYGNSPGYGNYMTGGEITDVKIIDLVPEPVSILLLLSGAFLAIRRRK